MKAVLDTSVLIAGGIGELEGDLAISAVSLAEIHFGVLVAPDEASRARRLRLLTDLAGTFDAIPVDQHVAGRWGQLAAAVRVAGRNPRPRSMDLLIAATALAHGARLYTRNADDLRGLESMIDIVALA